MKSITCAHDRSLEYKAHTYRTLEKRRRRYKCLTCPYIRPARTDRLQSGKIKRGKTSKGFFSALRQKKNTGFESGKSASAPLRWRRTSSAASYAVPSGATHSWCDSYVFTWPNMDQNFGFGWKVLMLHTRLPCRVVWARGCGQRLTFENLVSNEGSADPSSGAPRRRLAC